MKHTIMNQENIPGKMDDQFESRRKNNNIWTGLVLLIIGGILMARNAGVYFPPWFFSWPMILIAIGLFSGLRHRFKKGPWFVFLLIGVIFLADKISDTMYLRPYFWPILFIVGGIYMMLGSGARGARKRRRTAGAEHLEGSTEYQSGDSFTSPEIQYPGKHLGENEEIIDLTAIFSGVKRNLLSKNFKGGDIVAIMGGAEVNLVKADFTGHIQIDTFTMFGGIKLIVPPDWDVRSEIVAIFGGVDDKRPPAALHDPSKTIRLDGTCIFGGIEIRSY